MPVGSATGEAVLNDAVGAVDTAWVGAHAGSASEAAPAAEAAEVAESSTQICQPSGAGHENLREEINREKPAWVSWAE